MTVLDEGQKSRAICEDCKKVVDITYLKRDVPFSSGGGIVEDILVGVCDECDEVCSTPAQSTVQVAEAYKKWLSTR